MQPSKIIAGAALTASLALVALPGLAGSATPIHARSPEAAAFQEVQLDPGTAGANVAVGALDVAFAGAGALDAASVFPEPGRGGRATALHRARVAQPGASGGFDWKPARSTLTGIASFYDNGTTAMRLPRGTVIRVCGAGGCLERVVTDYGPFGRGRIIDLYRPDFFTVCGCASWSGTTKVTVYIY